jgi:DNA-binding NarL/FixJ family response regulator
MKRGTIKALLVSRYPVVRAGLRAMLKAPDIRLVGGAAKPEAALQLMNAEAPDLVLVDVRPGQKDDLDLLYQLNSKKRPRLSVVAFLTDESPVFLSRALAAGCAGYVPKNAERQELLRAVRAAARGEKMVDPTLLGSALKVVTQPGPETHATGAQQLTVPEREVLRLITVGHTNRQIAQRFGYSLGTVKDYVQRIIKKLGAADRTQAAVTAVRLGLLE